MAGPAEEVTLERPSEALDVYSETFDAPSFAASVALAAVSFAVWVAFVVVDSNRRAVRPVNLDDCRTTAREAGNNMMKVYDQGTEERGLSGCPDVDTRAIGRCIVSQFTDRSFFQVLGRNSESIGLCNRKSWDGPGSTTILNRVKLTQLSACPESSHLDIHA